MRDFNALDKDTQDIVKKVEEAIKSGAITVPKTKTELKNFTATLGEAPGVELKPAKIVLIVSQPKGEPFATLVDSGMQKLKGEMGDKLDYRLVESLDKAEHKEQVRTAAEMGANPVMVLWDDLANAVLEVAPDFPDTKFIILDSYVTADLPNVKTVVIEPQEASFIAGVVAAKKTQTKVLGFVGGADIPVIENFFSGFAAGVKYIDPSIEVKEVYAGTFIDPAKGLEVGGLLFKQGCDIVMHAANKTGLGVIKAAEEAKKLAIGVDMWQGDVAPGYVLWSALKPADVATYMAAKEAVEGKFTKGMWFYTLKEGAALYDMRDFNALDKDTQDIVKKVEEAIKSGAITVPKTKTELKNFTAKFE